MRVARLNFQNFKYLLQALLCLVISSCGYPDSAINFSVDEANQSQKSFKITKQNISNQKILKAASKALDNQGFILNSLDNQAGVIAAFKDEDNYNYYEAAGYGAVGLVTGMYLPPNNRDRIMASIFVSKLSGKATYNIEITLQKRRVDMNDDITAVEVINDEAQYQEIYEEIVKNL